MKRHWWNGSMTLLVIRDADQAVKQVSVSKMLVVSVPIVAVISISGLFLAMQWKSTAHIQELQGQVTSQTMALDVTVKDKDEAIRLLKSEVIRLSSQAESVKDQLEQMSSLEKQLQQFVEGYIAPSDASKHSAMLSTPSQSSRWNERIQVGGEDIEASTDQILNLANRSRIDLKQVSDMLNTMQRSVPTTLKQAQYRQSTIAGTPSIWPTKSRRITSSFGYRQDPMHGRAAFHAGLDIGGELGDPVYAAADGKVIEAGFQPARGNYIVIRHVNQLDTWYMHLQSILIDVNDTVAKGDRIAKLGNTGRSTGPHLHFQIVQRGEPIDPFPYVRNALYETTSSKKSIPTPLIRTRRSSEPLTSLSTRADSYPIYQS